MTSIQWGKAVFDDPNKLGDSPTPSRVPTGEYPMFKCDSANVLLDYVVPAGKTVDLKSLLLNVLPPACIFKAAGAACRAGTFYLDVDGVDKFEMVKNPMPLNSASGYETYGWWNQHRQMSLGEGIDFTTGQVLKVKVNPLAPAVGQRLAMKIFARLHGKEISGGSVSMQTGVLRTPATGSVVDILSFTVGANGFRLFSWGVQCWITEPFCASVQLYINSACVHEFGYLTFDGEKTTFGSGPNNGVLALLGMGWGVKLNHGDHVEVLGHAWLDYGQAAGVHLAMREESELGQSPSYVMGVS